MSKGYPDYMGVYKGTVVETALQKTKTSGMPQFVVRVFLTEYFDQKEDQWFDVSDNNWCLNAYLSLYGRKNSQSDGEIVETLNHQQVCKVFGWNGIGFDHLTTTDFTDKIVQVRVAENDYENAKMPVQIVWIDAEDADPNQGLQKLDAGAVKKLEAEFASLWAGKKPVTKAPVATAPKVAKPSAETPAPPPTDDKETKKKALLAKSKRLKAEAKKEPPAKPPAKEQTDESENAVPAGYNKKQAWLDIVELKDDSCDDEQLNAAWQAAIAEIAENGDEDTLDFTGWWAVKEQVLNDVGVL